MSKASLNRDVALRIGLAARALETVSHSDLLTILSNAVGLPIGKKALTALKLSTLRKAGGQALLNVPPEKVGLALRYLRGELVAEATDEAADACLPTPQAYRDGDMPGSIRVACASDSGEELNGHFGACARFLVYQVSADDVRLTAIRPAAAPEGTEDKTAHRAGLIGDCQVLFVASIGGPAAAKVVRAGVHPIKRAETAPARDVVAGLQPVLKGAPPPWLAKVIGHAPEQRVRFDFGAESPDA